MAGGRYNGLVVDMGGPATPAVGWASGIERLAMLLAQAPPAPRPIAVIPVGDAAETAALTLLQDLRSYDLRAEIAYRGSMKRRMERANKIGAHTAIIIGDAELASGVASVKDLDRGTQAEIPLDQIARHMAAAP
jgi:histidyl-tRNA synthetase